VGHVIATPAGTWRANWRDATGKQQAKTFRTKKEASVYLAEIESNLARGTYVDPRAGKQRFGVYAARWAESRVVGARSHERTVSVLRTHVLPKWERWPLAKIDHLAVQEWVRELSAHLAPATVAKCYGTLSLVLRSAVRSRMIALDPSEGVTLPSVRTRDGDLVTISRTDFLGKLLPAVPVEHRALVCAAAGAGLRWGECAGLPWSAVDVVAGAVRVAQVAEETSGATVLRAYPKTRAGRRTVPMAPFLVAELRAHLGRLPGEPDGRALVFGTRTGTALRRSNFRRQVWRPTLVRAGLLGDVAECGPDRWRAAWHDAEGVEWARECSTEREAVALVAERAVGGLRFHHLRHSYATWLVTAGVPVNVTQKVMGHESPSTTLNIYTHVGTDYGDAVSAAFAD
jgi:integrase